jgi:hypothetical protein
MTEVEPWFRIEHLRRCALDVEDVLDAGHGARS